jgi:hypothetical protein
MGSLPVLLSTTTTTTTTLAPPHPHATTTTVRCLEARLAQREADMLEAKQRAVAHHKQGLTHRAAVELARYKQLGALVGKLRGAVLNLLTIHYSIEGMSADVAVFEGLKGGSEALRQQRSAVKKAGLASVRDVDEAMEEARELVAETQELSAALAQPMVEEGEEEKEELLRELEALEKEEEEVGKTGQEAGKKAVDVADLAAALPDVSHLPPLPRVAAPKKEEEERGADKSRVALSL